MGTNTPELETSRLMLRKFTKDDIDALFAIYSDRDVNTFLPWFPIQTRDEAKQLFEEKYVKGYARSAGYQYAICLKKDNIPIGYVHVSADESHDLGYALRKEFWGQGIMTEACKAVLSQVKEDGLETITATHDVKNPRSGEVMKRLGMKYQYSYEEEWQPKNILVTFRLYQLDFHGENPPYRKYWDRSAVHFIETDV